MADADSSTKVRTPPYVAFKTFLTLIEDLQTHGLPPIIDRSVLKRFSGGVGSQLLMALKSLGLCTEDNKPTTSLAALVKNYKTNEPAFKDDLNQALDHGFPFLKSINLMSATPGMFADAFKVTGAKEDVLKKCRRFYLTAAQAAGLSIGPRILGGMPKAPRGSGQPGVGAAAPRRKATKQSKRSDPPPPGGGGRSNSPDLSVHAQLLAKFPAFDPAWSDELKASWFAGFKDLMAASKSGGG